MNWNKYPESKPTYTCSCYVTNTKTRGCFEAIYQHPTDIFTLRRHESNYLISAPIEVTHWLELPGVPIRVIEQQPQDTCDEV